MLENIKVEKRRHQIWDNMDKVPSSFPPIIGEWQYIYSSLKGKISLVSLPNYYHDGKDFWEIYSLEGVLFEDVERFPTKEEAEQKIDELLA